jgi:hypothetical protein
MNIEEVAVYGQLIEQRISNVLSKRAELFKKEEWKDLMAKLKGLERKK